MELSISNVINISVNQPGVGAGQYNTSNLAIYSNEVPAISFGLLGYKIYLSPNDVAVDFGTDSITYKQALSIFSQSPNILANNGYLVVIPMTVESQRIAFSTVPDEGSLIVNFNGDTATLLFDDTLSVVQTKIRTLTGLEKAVVTGSYAAGFTIAMYGFSGNAPAITFGTNTLETSNVPVVVSLVQVAEGQTLAQAITANKELVQHFGIISTAIVSQTDVLAAAAVVQAENKILGVVVRTQADVEPSGTADLVRLASFKKTRVLAYIGLTEVEALLYLSSYFGRGLSTNFNGDSTTQTMHLKDLAGVLPDPGMNQTILNLCKNSGADIYVSLEGVPKTFTSGANDFFDNQYNLAAYVGDLKIAGFNLYAQTPTKIPQTEQGMDLLKKVYADVNEKYIVNGFIAAGSWTNATTFGNLADFLTNILERGYYIFSQPITQQSAASREDREAPLVQIAIKYAGAQHSSSVIVNVNP